MDNEITVFSNNNFGSIRTIMIEDEPWFVGKDVAIALGYTNTNKTLADHVDSEDKKQGDGVTIRDPIGREQHPTIINESGLYSLIMSSKLPTAKDFKRWVTSEVLPSIRKTGGYNTIDQRTLINIGIVIGRCPSNETVSLVCDSFKKSGVLPADFEVPRYNANEPEKAVQLHKSNSVTTKGAINPMKELLYVPSSWKMGDEAWKVSQIASAYRISARALNCLLARYDVQVKDGAVYYLTEQYQNRGLEVRTYYKGHPTPMWWTDKGCKFIYTILGQHGIFPKVPVE